MSKVNFNGTWIEVRREGFDELIQLSGFPGELQKKFVETKMKLVVQQKGDKGTLEVTTGLFANTYHFVVNGEDQAYTDIKSGKRGKMKSFWKGDKMVTYFEGKEDKCQRELYLEGDLLVYKTIRDDGKVADVYLEKLTT